MNEEALDLLGAPIRGLIELSEDGQTWHSGWAWQLWSMEEPIGWTAWGWFDARFWRV